MQFRRPRYLTVISSPIYGSRDEIIGTFDTIVDTGYTRKFMERRADRLAYNEYDNPELYMRIVDTTPGELDPSWPMSSPWEPPYEGPDLPF